MTILTKEHILLLHRQLIDNYGGTHGVKDEGLLDSALNIPFQSYGEQNFYPTVIDKAVRLGYGLVKNHPFHDGNKRIGAHAMLVMLQLNHIVINTNSKEIIDIFLRLASGDADDTDLLIWVKQRIK